VGDNRIDITFAGSATSSLRWATKDESGLLDIAGLDLEAGCDFLMAKDRSPGDDWFICDW
jgi:hypothetical protein